MITILTKMPNSLISFQILTMTTKAVQIKVQKLKLASSLEVWMAQITIIPKIQVVRKVIICLYSQLYKLQN